MSSDTRCEFSCKSEGSIYRTDQPEQKKDSGFVSGTTRVNVKTEKQKKKSWRRKEGEEGERGRNSSKTRIEGRVDLTELCL